MAIIKSITLYCRNGSSDKVYNAQIEEKDGGYIVGFSYGRRGSTLTTGTKTTAPVDLDAAVKVFDNLVAGKKAKGYTEGEDGAPYLHTDSDIMSTLAEHQRALDLYAGAVCWQHADPNGEDADTLAAALRERAAGVATEDQLADAERYARKCVADHRKPLMAGRSFAHFRDEAGRAAHNDATGTGR